MGRRTNMGIIGAILMAALLQCSVAQTTHTVGDSTGWTIPNGGSSFYSNWAAAQTFSVGDILVFNYASGAHDVAEVTSAAYGSCDTTSPISHSTTPPTSITLNSTGQHFFICTFPGHCSAGQTLSITVSGTSTTTPSSPSPAATTAPPPENSATSLGVAALSAAFLPILAALLY